MLKRARLAFRHALASLGTLSLVMMLGWVAQLQSAGAQQPDMAELWNGAEIE